MATAEPPDGDELLLVLAALANPHRLRIIAALTRTSTHSSQLARDLGMSRPLLHMHAQRLEAAGLIAGRLELSEDGKALRYYEVTDFAVTLDPAGIAHAAASLTAPSTAARTKGQH